jgi:hypothetical protein
MANTSKALPEPPKQESIITTRSTSTEGVETPLSESEKAKSPPHNPRHEVQPPREPLTHTTSETKGMLNSLIETYI